LAATASGKLSVKERAPYPHGRKENEGKAATFSTSDVAARLNCFEAGMRLAIVLHLPPSSTYLGNDFLC
jgi:hypothetical protein